MGIKAISPTTVYTENFGDTTLYIADFDTSNPVNENCGSPGITNGDSDVWNSSMPAIVGYWFHATDDPTTQTSGRVDVSLNAVSTGQFKFFSSEKNKTGKLYILSLS